MSRAIRLSRIHAINWYGYNDSLPVEGNLLLAGVTGSGKSVLMDLVMTVLVGSEAAHFHFNRSATGGRSDRTLKSYCLLDTKREENGITQYLRPAAITYVALEFVWPAREGAAPRVETWGLRVEFRNTAETQGHIRPFICPSSLSKADFLDADRRPLEAAAFRKLIDKQRGGRLFETQEQYLREMAGETHLNFNRAVLGALLPQAMSFTNLKSFDEFCRRFILPDDKLNVGDVVASYRSFLAYERDLRELFEQQQRLEAIRDLHALHTASLRDRLVARRLAAELAREHAAAFVRDEEKTLARHQSAYAREAARLAELDELVRKTREERDRAQALIGQTSDGQLYLYLKSHNASLSHEIERLRAIRRTVDAALRSRARKARQWLAEAASAPVSDPPSTEALEQAITTLENCEAADTEAALAAVSAQTEQLKSALNRSIQPAVRALKETRERKGALQEEIAHLAAGRLPFPATLLNALNDALPPDGKTPAAQPLCALCEVTDETWRPAIEVAFTRKFAIVVSEAHYDRALKIYHTLKAGGARDFHRESLVNPKKVRAKTAAPNSLATKLKSKHPVATALIRQLFGDLICVQTLDQLNDPAIDRGILPDGFMSGGPFVERRRHYDGLPFVGKLGLERQLALKRDECRDLDAQERRLAPVLTAVQGVIEHAAQFIPDHAPLARELFEVRRLAALETELKQNITRLNSIDRASFEEREKRLATLGRKLEEWEWEQRGLLQSEKRGEIKALENALATAREREAAAAAALDRAAREEGDLSPHAKRLKEWRADILARFPALDAAAREFERLERDADKQAGVSWEQLKAARHELALAYRKFEDLLPDNPSNDPWARLLDQIAGAGIPEYKSKAEAERKRWENLFRTNLLQRMDQALRRVNDTIVLLNDHLKQPIGADRYQIERRPNPDFRLYRQLIDLNAQFQDDGLFFQAVQGQLQKALEHFLEVPHQRPGIHRGRPPPGLPPILRLRSDGLELPRSPGQTGERRQTKRQNERRREPVPLFRRHPGLLPARLQTPRTPLGRPPPWPWSPSTRPSPKWTPAASATALAPSRTSICRASSP